MQGVVNVLNIPAGSIPLDKTKISFDSSESTVTVSAGRTYAVPHGIYYVTTGANTSIQYSPDGGTTWREYASAGSSAIVFSDGSNVRLSNAGTADEDSYLLKLV